MTALLASGEASALLPHRPAIAVVMPVYRGNPELLSQAIGSLRQQVGFDIECLISIDGCQQDLPMVEQVLAGLGAEHQSTSWRVSLLLSDVNRGVGMCRNRAFEALSPPFFTCLDADDIFHPLRCMHALVVLLRERLMRLNTGWSRASFFERKAVLINDRLSHVGHNSFVARSELLREYGYQANLRFFEDTEFMLRHRFYGVAMKDSPVVGHFLHSEPTADHVSLSSPCRLEAHVVVDHPYLCGTVLAEQPSSWREIERDFQERYRSLPREELASAFPGCSHGGLQPDP